MWYGWAHCRKKKSCAARQQNRIQAERTEDEEEAMVKRIDAMEPIYVGLDETKFGSIDCSLRVLFAFPYLARRICKCVYIWRRNQISMGKSLNFMRLRSSIFW